MNKKSLEENYQAASLLEKYIGSLTHLYGRVTKDTIVEIYNTQNETTIDVEEVEHYLANPPALFEEALVFVKDEEFISEDLMLFEVAYEELVEAQRGKPLYVPKQEELFLCFNPHYTEYPKAFQKLVKYLQENLYEGNEQSALSKAEDIHLAIEMGDGLRGAVNELKRHDHHFDESQHSQELLNILKRLHNNTRTREK